MFEKADLVKLKKIGAYDLLSLVMIAPKGYEDYRVKSSFAAGESCAVQVLITAQKNSPRAVFFDGHSSNFDLPLKIVYFNPKPYHKKMFSIGEEVLLYGKLQQDGSLPQLIQPKKISPSSTVTPVYSASLNQATVRALIKKYISFDTLAKEGLPKSIANDLLSMHFPLEKGTDSVQKGLGKNHIDALKFCEIYRHLKLLSSKKTYHEAIKPLSGETKKFIASLPFSLTDDQKKAIVDIEADLKKPSQARRMIIGDVGCGKTMVILASAMIAEGSKSILMAPTSILANQIFLEAKMHVGNFLKIALYTQSNKPKLPLEGYDFIIGTHALLHAKLPEAALIMVDEQHRFGSNQRQLLSKLTESDGKKPHFLQFSATPIPRTQAMINSCLLDISTIRQTPFKKEITSEIIGRDGFGKLLGHIKSEAELGAQIAIIYPLVEESEAIGYQSIEEGAPFWQQRFENVYVTHGRDKEKEETLKEFKEKGSIIIATTVMEVGISLERLSTIVIVGAERLGLATLHQLRGRVSRAGQKGYCFLYTNSPNSERLVEFCKCKSGFEIAELDLKYRKSGDLISGERQSGESFEWIDLSTDEHIIKAAKEALQQNSSGY